MKRKSKKHYKFSINLGFRELLGVTLAALLFFVLPITAYNYYLNQEQEKLAETYTSEALARQEIETGRVAGVDTVQNQIENDKYIMIPIINFRFDKTLSETASIYVLFGGLLLVGGLILAISLIADANKVMVIPRR